MVNKALYGLRQSNRERNSEINTRLWILTQQHRPSLVRVKRKDEFELVLIYVDDLLCAPTKKASKL